MRDGEKQCLAYTAEMEQIGCPWLKAGIRGQDRRVVAEMKSIRCPTKCVEAGVLDLEALYDTCLDEGDTNRQESFSFQ